MVRSKFSKLLLVICIFSLCLFYVSFNVFYVNSTCCRKNGFDKSKYTLTGDMAKDVATIAKSQKGRFCDDFGYSGVDYGLWCDEFVADCIENAGGDSSIVAHGGTVADFEKVMLSKGAKKVTSPQTGDLVFFTYSHVEIVTKVVNGVVYSAGGNNNDPDTNTYHDAGCCAGEHKASDIRLYLRPNYPSDKHSVNIHYNANGGTVASDSKYYIGSGNDLYRKSDDKLMGPTWADGYKDKDGLVNASTIKLTRSGYHFVGWSTSKSGGKIFDQDDNTVSANDIFPDVKSKNGTVMLYAQWELNKVRMLYNANGGTIESGGTYSANDDGYICKDGNTMPLSPIWENGYTDPNGLYNASTFKLARTGYHFVGWSTSESGGKIFDQDDNTISAKDLLPDIDSKSGSITLYAQWEENKLTINYNSNGGNIASGGDYYTDSNGGIYETSTKELKAQNWAYNKGGTNGLCNASTFKLARTGYHFVGWSTSKSGGKIYDQDNTSLLSNDISADVKTKNVKVTMYAQWEENIVTVRYNTNGGISMAESPEFYTKDNYVYRKADSSEVKSQWKYGQTAANGFYDCTSFDMYREGYKFVGWGTSATGGTVYSDTAELKINSLCDLTSRNVDMIVYAQWEKVPSTIDLYQNTSGLNYMLGSDLVGSEKEIHPDNTDHSSVKFDSLNTHNGQPIVNVNALQADSKHTYTHLVTKTSLTACASNGAYPESKKYYLSFYAKAPQNDSTLEVRWGYDGIYKSVQLTTDWKWYSIEMQKVPVSDNWIHWYFNKTGNYQISHLMVTDTKCTEESFIAESENSPVSKINYTIGKAYGKLPVPEREGYDFIGWFTSRNGGEEITADTIAEKGVTLYAHWKKSAEIQGDVNADGKFDVADAVLLQQYLLGNTEVTLDDWQKADLYEDGELNSFDLCLLKKKLNLEEMK